MEPAAFHLRFRDDAATTEPPDVAAFLRSSAPPEHPRPDDLGVIPGTRPADPDGPLVIFLQQPEFGIPAPGYDHSLPDLEAWSVRPTTFGWIATVQPANRGPRRAAQVIAASLALALPTHADAFQAPATAPPVQAPASQPAKKAEPTAATQPTATQPATSPAPQPAPAPVVNPPTSPVTVPGPVVTPPPPLPASAYENSAVTDAAWQGVDGFEVVVELKGGKVIRGRVGAVQADTFTLIDGSDGQILVIPKTGVASLRAYVPPPIPTKTGTGLIVGGSILTALGIPVFITGVTFLGVCPSCWYLHIPMLVIGGGALGGGIPMLVRGTQQRTAFQRALEERRVAPMVTRNLGGWNGGLQIRF
jgi:hypothetical protein